MATLNDMRWKTTARSCDCCCYRHDESDEALL